MYVVDPQFHVQDEKLVSISLDGQNRLIWAENYPLQICIDCNIWRRGLIDRSRGNDRRIILYKTCIHYPIA